MVFGQIHTNLWGLWSYFMYYDVLNLIKMSTVCKYFNKLQSLPWIWLNKKSSLLQCCLILSCFFWGSTAHDGLWQMEVIWCLETVQDKIRTFKKKTNKKHISNKKRTRDLREEWGNMTPTSLTPSYSNTWSKSVCFNKHATQNIERKDMLRYCIEAVISVGHAHSYLHYGS